MRIGSGIALVTVACALALLADSGQTVPFPAGYRTWTVTRSFIAPTPASIITMPIPRPWKASVRADFPMAR